MIRSFSKKGTRVIEAHLLTFGYVQSVFDINQVILAALTDQWTMCTGSSMTDTISCSHNTMKNGICAL